MSREDRKISRRALLAAGVGGLSLMVVGGNLLFRTRRAPPVIDTDLVIYRNPAFTRIEQGGGRVRFRTRLAPGEEKLLETDMRGADLIAAAPGVRVFEKGARTTVADLVDQIQTKYPNDPQLADGRSVQRFIQQAIAHGVLLAEYQKVYLKGRAPFAEA